MIHWISTLAAFLLAIQGIGAQTLYPISTEARASADHFAKLYELNQEQSQRIASIEARLERHLDNISPLRDSDLATYLSKLQAAYEGRQNSISTILNDSQTRIFQLDTKWMRRRQAEQRIESVKAGASRIEAEEAALSIKWEANPDR